jgi:hypothetical protein
LCDNENCIDCFNKSFASHEKSKYWSKENKLLKPRDVFKGTHILCKFDCPSCPHTFEMSPGNITGQKDTWCQYCCIPTKMLCDNDSCQYCFEKSFASNKLCILWDDKKNGSIKPRNVLNSTKNEYYFKCDKCPHSFSKKINQIIKLKNSGCQYCTKGVLCDNKNCVYCFYNSFASNYYSKFWDKEKNGNVKPREVFKDTADEYYFKCDKCPHSFKRFINHISDINYWCLFCSGIQLCDDNNCHMCSIGRIKSNPINIDMGEWRIIDINTDYSVSDKGNVKNNITGYILQPRGEEYYHGRINWPEMVQANPPRT